ncbi:single-stranded DNA-binding protein [Zobellia galactanivorans]|uniref:Single-stranded DNA-binding protein n=1 Tax=Zobellia galactanivorans (strain DSM 12802 / CCUG 47099 / CIP 106680 / NCIMB 13871 / Dsij) TaxID=63186 RepID=G0L3S2_ZOBGA|nr:MULTISPECIES: single-stranded DNA-binding protein [Zobellia]MBU3028099.1 single-stranded DNA-binding protein [Zobellia galactanivorans]MDO6515826.1 single-stranded DNA-binding protein [Zobellia uliginosa]MDO6808380.1 single-stranded DNA-binding protein [Zobellia galactanivorans]OWW26481.1 single-stranded DNA-binding protein [Zobellia sp. OII3]CAZ95427.1 Single-stranded DNA-binding protein [Zobellia galactanivorans]
MSGTLNKVMLIGHLGDEVKMHYFEGGGCIGRFPIATNETYTNKQTGERVTNTDWHNVVVRNKAAEICEKYLSKGDKVYVEGRLKNRQWQGEDGNTRYSTEVHVQDFTFLSTKKESMANQQSGGQQARQNTVSNTSSAPKEAPLVRPEEDDDLPF